MKNISVHKLSLTDPATEDNAAVNGSCVRSLTVVETCSGSIGAATIFSI